MAEDNPFRTLAADIKNKLASDQRKTWECLTVMNETVRPAMKDARRFIRHPRIVWDDGNQPSVRVEGKEKNVLQYTCNGTLLEVVHIEHGVDISRDFDLKDVSKALIVTMIKDFLREALEIESTP
jgi:hypothetical protein